MVSCNESLTQPGGGGHSAVNVFISVNIDMAAVATFISYLGLETVTMSVPPELEVIEIHFSTAGSLLPEASNVEGWWGFQD